MRHNWNMAPDSRRVVPSTPNCNSRVEDLLGRARRGQSVELVEVECLLDTVVARLDAIYNRAAGPIPDGASEMDKEERVLNRDGQVENALYQLVREAALRYRTE